MSSTHPPFVLHEYKHEFPQTQREHRAHEPERPRLPPLPDLRFELTYLRSIQPFVHIHRISKSFAGKADKKESSTDAALVAESIEVEWRRVLWVTLRDQIISPLFQGAIWAIISFYFSPFSARVGHELVASRDALIRKKEGLGVGWLRKWVHSLGLSSWRA
ncbi:hypothetical protein GYMLUDRAFT_45040 [Collybiopsis luxurians FD-317 M1]|uniref:Uncharacterized protein n=1 Tax=Collybiopsis luxurians FD-317 M1 TaxID=944289 RepID=A0A0D0CJU3_9AGAR|nr:hypothetical protein GYMLUDRAFT_45040 [Collybiopsis luxurians FD-317 M1]